MTVQQYQPTTVRAPAPVPTPRQAAHDHLTPMVIRQAGSWVSYEERLMCRLMIAMMLGLGLFAVLMVWLSARVW